jgi:hypothetical protein
VFFDPALSPQPTWFSDVKKKEKEAKKKGRKKD